MKRFLVVIVAALALPAATQAKELTGLTVCGPDDCESGAISGFGHRPPMSPAGMSAPPPGSYYTLSFSVDGHEDAWTGLFYEPRAGLVAVQTDVTRWMTWNRPEPAVAALLKRLAARVEPFPAPTITEVRIGKRVVGDGSATYLALLRLDGEYVSPIADEPGVAIQFAGNAAGDPWTSSSLVYYPADDVLVRGSGQSFRVPAGLAADIEAGRPLGAGEPTGIPWIALAILLGGGLALFGAFHLRRAPERRVGTVH